MNRLRAANPSPPTGRLPHERPLFPGPVVNSIQQIAGYALFTDDCAGQRPGYRPHRIGIATTVKDRADGIFQAAKMPVLSINGYRYSVVHIAGNAIG